MWLRKELPMYNVGDYVVHKVDGLCQISEISSLDIPDVDQTKQYYFLIPTLSPASKIYVAVGTGESSLRDPVTHDEALALIDSIPELPELSVDNEKTRQNTYNQALAQNDVKELFRLIKTTYSRKQDRLSKGRTATSMDEHFLKSAQHALFSELSYALGMESDSMDEFIEKRLNK
ncbi:MAG: CarD family transcriptional regulator [Lachnospiraceae bacterium]|nr:CarD family transcriptional regulator [Lachnospiraceae bacterium]